MEVVGVIAASTELAKVAWSCCEMIKKLRNAPKRFEEYAKQLNSVATIAEKIRDDPDLRTIEVKQSLEPILKTIAALETRLSDHHLGDHIKSWRRLKNRIGLVADDVELLKLFDSLEKQKSALLLLFSSQLARMPRLFGMVEEIHSRAVASPNPAVSEDSRPVYAVPSLYCKLFVGRNRLIDSLERWVTGHVNRLGTQVTVLRALGGQGKSQIALHLCQRLRTKDLFAILWVDATSELTLRNQFSALSGALQNGHDESDSNRSGIALTINRLQDSSKPWLMVLDNYDACETFLNVREYIPDCPYGSVIVTSRHGQSSELVTDFSGKDIQLRALEKNDAVDFVLRSSGTRASEREIRAAERIVNTLAFHPLALAQTAAFIKRRKMDMLEFEHYYEKQKVEILKSEPSLALAQYQKNLEGHEQRTTLNVFTTWELSYKQLQLLGQTSTATNIDRIQALSALLEICAFTGPLGFSDTLIKHYLTPQKEGMPRSPSLIKSMRYFVEYNPITSAMTLNSQRLKEGVADLEDLSLIQSLASESERTTCRITLHPLVRDWLRLRSSREQQVDFTWYATSLVGVSLFECFDESFLGFRVAPGQRGEMLEHVQAIADNYLQNQAAAPTSPQCLPQPVTSGSEEHRNSVVDTSSDEESFYDAVESISLHSSRAEDEGQKHKSAYRNREESLSVEPQSIRLTPENIFDFEKQRHLSATGQETMGDHAVSCLGTCVQFCLSMYQGSLARDIVTRTFPDWQLSATTYPDNLPLCRFLLNLVQVPIIQEQDQLAEALSGQFVELYDAKSSSDAIKCIPLFWHATALQNSQQHGRAMTTFRRSEALFATSRGPSDHMTLLCRGNIALCLSKMGKREEALELFTSTITDMKRALPLDCPMTMDVEFKASCTLLAVGRIDEAIVMRRDMLARFESAIGEEHVETIRSMEYLASALRVAGRTEEADTLKERIAKLRANGDSTAVKSIR